MFSLSNNNNKYKMLGKYADVLIGFKNTVTKNPLLPCGHFLGPRVESQYDVQLYKCTCRPDTPTLNLKNGYKF